MAEQQRELLDAHLAGERVMALDGTYEGLKAAIVDWALPGGGEPEFEAAVPDIIRLAEARFDRELRTSNMIGTSLIETDDLLIGVPDDCLEVILLSPWSPDRAQYSSMDSLTLAQEVANRLATGNPRGFTIMDGGLRPVPAPLGMTKYELVYYRSVSRLNDDDQPTNWILQTAPDLYLYASLAAAAAYLKNPEEIGVWAQSAADMIDKINERSLRAEYARGKPLVRSISLDW
jgi:hypothetical protein